MCLIPGDQQIGFLLEAGQTLSPSASTCGQEFLCKAIETGTYSLIDRQSGSYNIGELNKGLGFFLKDISMTKLSTHSVAHSTKPSSRPKTNNQPPKKFLSLTLS